MHKSIKSIAYGAIATLYTTVPVWADDTEIYFGGTANLFARPNVMFVLDTSGSMDDPISGPHDDRLEAMQDSMQQILSSAQDINAGVMNFSNPGGPVLYPVRNLDDQHSGFAPIDGSASSRISSTNDDLEQRVDGTVVLDAADLSAMERDPYTSIESKSYLISQSSDDGFYRNDSSQNSRKGAYLQEDTSAWLNTRRRNKGRWDEQTHWFKFRNVDIPAGVSVANSSIEFVAQDDGRGAPEVKIKAELNDSPAAVSNSSGNKLSDRTYSNKITWDIDSAYDPDSKGILTAPWKDASNSGGDNLNPIITELLNMPSWDSGDQMMFVLEPYVTNRDNYRRVSTYDGIVAPKLNISYEKANPFTENSWVALRFNNVAVPQGATITSATLRYRASEDSNSGGSLIFRAEDSDDSAPFIGSSNEVGLRTKTTAIVAGSTLSAWSKDSQYESPNLKDVVQEVTDRTGWCGGNNLTILISGISNAKKQIISFDNDSGNAPILDIEYDVNSVANDACFAHTATFLVQENRDDAESSSSGYSHSNSVLTLGYKGAVQQYTGIRFNDVKLKKDAKIRSAYIELSVGDTDSVLPASLQVGIEDSSNSQQFSSSSKPTYRSLLGTKPWNISSGWNQVGQVYRSPDIGDFIQSVAAKSGWQSGNAISAIITGSSGSLEVGSKDGSTLVPKLVINASQDHFDIPAKTVRERLQEIVNGLDHKGYTPAVGAYTEAARYFKGMSVKYGLDRGVTSPSRIMRVSHPDSYIGGTVSRPSGCNDKTINTDSCSNEEILTTPTVPQYISPITESCQKSYIILLTDGYANRNASTEAKKVMKTAANPNPSCVYRGSSGGETCGFELAAFLNNNDHSGLPGTQSIQTYTIGFGAHDDPWLKGISETHGGGKYYFATSATQLTSVFNNIIKTIKASNSSFAQPGFTVNDLNRLSHREDIYYSMFKPVELQKWSGNLKKYRIDGYSGKVVDQNGNEAVDTNTGFFDVNAKSYWSANPDGYYVEQGGAASNLPKPSTRKIYTYTGGYPAASDGTEILTHLDNAVTDANTALTKALLGIASESDGYRTSLINWTRGENADGHNRFSMGDPLHSVPVLMTYSSDAINKTYDSTVYVATNEGYLHAIDVDSGIEKFAFIPKELLPNLDKFKTNAAIGSGSRVYGLDGDLTIISNDSNNDGDFTDNLDSVWLYMGMRRGGRNYYGLDVKDRDHPKLKWVIKGGIGGTSGFEELGQTWSKPIEIEVKFDGNRKTVLLFAGGYDPSQDSRTTRAGDAQGRAIYMVDPDTGALFWSAGLTNSYDLQLTDMNYSIPSDITVIDLNSDGLADQFYVGDMGGQLWRFDLHNGATATADLVTGGVIAELSSTTAASNRRFYYAPDLSLSVEGSNKVLAVGIGSGWRAHPLDETVKDRYYLIKQFNDIFSAPSSYTKLTEANLYDATENYIAEGDADQKSEAQLALANGSSRTKEGWYIKLDRPGEKVLAKSLTVNGEIIFTTYEPEPPDTVQCQPVQGTARAYIVKILTAEPVRDLSGDGNLNKSDREVQLDQGAIPASPKIIDPETGSPVILIGPEVLEEADSGRQIRKTYWRETQQ